MLGPIDHGMCQSMYFAGPDNLSLEVATSATAIDGEHWIDPEVVALCNIDADELEALKHPEPTKVHDTPVPQPAYDESKPNMTYPSHHAYLRAIATPDDVIWERASITTPPVP